MVIQVHKMFMVPPQYTTFQAKYSVNGYLIIVKLTMMFLEIPFKKKFIVEYFIFNL